MKQKNNNQMKTNPYEVIFKEIADGLLENAEFKPIYSNAALFDVTIIFQSVFMDKMYDKFPPENRLEMAEKAGNDLRKLIIQYTGLDTYELAKNV